MRSCITIAFWIFISTVISVQAHSQCPDYGLPSDVTPKGTSFLIAFPQVGIKFSVVPDTTKLVAELYLLSSDDTALVTLTSRAYPAYRKELVILPNKPFSYRISDDIDLRVKSSEIIEDRTLFITSSYPITCVCKVGQRIATIEESFQPIPLHSAGLEYRVMSYWTDTSGMNISLQEYYSLSEFIIGAVYDNTEVTIIPTTTTYSGSPAGVPLTYILQSGQAVQIQSKGSNINVDMSGSKVTSNKPIIVNAGNSASQAPIFMFLGREGNGDTPMVEAIPPIQGWGNIYVSQIFEPRLPGTIYTDFYPPDSVGDVFRVLSLNNNTIVRVNGTIWGEPLKANEFRDTLIRGKWLVESTTPILACQFSHGIYVTGDQFGSQFMAMVPTVEQLYNDYSVYLDDIDSSFSWAHRPYTHSYVQISTEVSGRGKIRINGTLMPDTGFTTLPLASNGKQYAIGAYRLEPGYYHITSDNPPEKGFVAIVYGYAYYAAYGYGSSSLQKPLRGIHPVSLPEAGIHPGAPKENVAAFRNILYEKVYLDSSQIILDDEFDGKYQITQRERIWQDISELTSAEVARIHLDCVPLPEKPIRGKLRVWHHTYKWRNFTSVDIPFEIDPLVCQLSLKDGLSQDRTYLFPNPATETIHCYTASDNYERDVELFDALGRKISHTTIAANSNTQTMDVGKYTSGTYFVRIGGKLLKFLKF